MVRKLAYSKERHQSSRNYLFFFFALTGVILIPGLLAPILPVRKVYLVFYILTILIGVYTVTADLKQFTFGIVTGFLTLLYTIGTHNFISPSPILDWVGYVIGVSFFCFLFIKCLQEVFRHKEVDFQTIYAAICGYLIMGIMGTITFSFIHRTIPGSFSNTTNESLEFLYFSFITLTTLGYGDITPIHSIPRSLVILFSVSGQLYLTILVALLIGKFVTEKHRK